MFALAMGTVPENGITYLKPALPSEPARAGMRKASWKTADWSRSNEQQIMESGPFNRITGMYHYPTRSLGATAGSMSPVQAYEELT